jgi:hypothetical protein
MMPITRRSLLQTLGALPAAWSFNAFAQEIEEKKTGCSVKKPSPTSIFVLFEGPWLIFPSRDDGWLTAVTIGTALDDDVAGFKHSCAVETWFCNTRLSETELPAGHQWTMTGAGFDDANSFGDVMTKAFDGCKNNGAWISKQSPIATCHPGDRSVVLPVPTHIHIAGFLKNATVDGDGYLEKSGVNPHIVTILEYVPTGNPLHTFLSLVRSNSCEGYKFTSGAHLIFRLQHSGEMDEVTHIKAAFAHLQGHVSSGSHIAFNMKSGSDTGYLTGDNYGFTPLEMGLDPKHCEHVPVDKLPNDCPRQNNFANCCGGGIIVGDGG